MCGLPCTLDLGEGVVGVAQSAFLPDTQLVEVRRRPASDRCSLAPLQGNFDSAGGAKSTVGGAMSRLATVGGAIGGTVERGRVGAKSPSCPEYRAPPEARRPSERLRRR
jgi:hypothetical protein